MRHENKIALITGAGRGLGRNTALKLAESGADLVIIYRNSLAGAEEVREQAHALGRKAVVMQLDAADTSRFDAFAKDLRETLRKEWDREDFDILVNNAGIDICKPFLELNEQDFDDLLNVHFKGVFFLTQKLLPLLRDGASIVNTSTGLARFTTPGFSAYASMKGAVEVFTRYLAKELGPRRIRANCVAPGPVETDFTRAALARPGSREFMNNATALGRVGVPDDIGEVVNFLCSKESGWINGQRIEASGGIFL
jgi:NAD(P)-dependent dehydrogenase (short-subunit alcohol dehydrogenase family)